MLFRQEAIDHSTDKLGGDVLLLPKPSYILITTFLVIWVGLIAAWLVSSEYSRKESVVGWVEPDRGVVKVYNPNEGSVVEELFVSEGQLVKIDDKIALVRSSKALAESGELTDLLREQLEGQQQLFEQQRERATSDYPNTLQYAKGQLQSARSELEELEKQKGSLDQQEALEKLEVSKLKKLLDKRLISQSEYNRANKALLSVQSNLSALSRGIKQQEGLVQKLENSLSLLPTGHKNKLAELDSRLNELNQRFLQVSAQGQVVVKAPITGRVDSVQNVVGQRVPRTTPILTLIPENSELKVNLLVPIRAVGFIEVGQSIDIRYNAFPYQKFGTYKATITKVPEHILLPNEVLNLPAELKEAIYKVEAELDESTVLAYGKEVQLKSGMTLAADIYLGRRSLMEWLLEPLYSLRGRLQ